MRQKTQRQSQREKDNRKQTEKVRNKIIEENFSRLQNTEIFILEVPDKYSAM